MYRQRIPKKTSPSSSSIPINQQTTPTSGYGSLSGVIQRATANPESLSRDEWLQLDGAIGTRATKEIKSGKRTSYVPEFKGVSAQLWGDSGGNAAPIQAKLTIGAVRDKYEQEADRVAAEVVQQISRPAPGSNAQGEVVQEKENKEGELQLKPMVQLRADAGGEASSNLTSAINSARGGGQPLAPRLQTQMGQAMGADFSGVRVHTDAQSDRLNQSLQAKAFTTGQDVFFRQGAYQPGSRGGQKLIAHELTHVVQQNGGAVRQSLSISNTSRPHSSLQDSFPQIQRKGGKAKVNPSIAESLGRVQPSVQGAETANISYHHEMIRTIQRKLDGSLKGRDVQRRLETVLTTAGGFLKPPNRELYKQILKSKTVYTWDMIERDFSNQFVQNLGGYVMTGTRQVTLYRADGRSPGKLKGANPPGFGVRASVPFGLLKAALLKNPNAFAEDHVRNNRQDLKSYATDMDAGGYASGRHLYKIDFGLWWVFERPSQKGKLPSAAILANNQTLQGATKIAIDTRKPTKEIFLLFEVELEDIGSVRAPKDSAFAPIHWDSI
ncbi:MAG: DUF4157 domain-containing protein [Cyanobacteria bacterium P01_A01_bin.80]